jgi:hypothetical protein
MNKISKDEFKKSSFYESCSSCVEVAIRQDIVVIRNSEDITTTVTFTLEEWSVFAGVKNGEFDL